MIDVVSELIELLLAGGIPAPELVEGQRRVRLAAAIVALTVILVGQSLSAAALRIAFVVAGSIAALWILACSLVDLIKEFPPVRWQSIAAGTFAGAGLLVALALMFGAV